MKVHPEVSLNDYQICQTCVMDTSDPSIVFDQDGNSHHVNDYYRITKPQWDLQLSDSSILHKQLAQIRKSGKNKEYDCIIGLSGGVDSSYLLHIAVNDFGLRPLVFHVDGGWNSELAVHNIQSLVDKTGVDLYTEVINWEEMRDFQLAFLKSGVPHIDIPQDHAFVGTLYKYAQAHGIKYILNGGNFSTECVRNPMTYFYYGTDPLHLRDIISKFGTTPMPTYPFSSVFRHKIYLRYFKGLKVFRPLNFIHYNKADAVNTLRRTYGWRPYPQKHFESIFTKFYESYWLPERFGFDPRRVQFSSLILTGQMTREEALNQLESPPYDPLLIHRDFEYVANKLRIGVDQLNAYLHLPRKYYWDYRNMHSLFRLGAQILSFSGLEGAFKR